MKIEDSVLSVLSGATVSGSQLFLNGQLDRAMYVKVNKVLEAAGGKWNRKAKAHVFDGDAATRIDEIILTGEVTIPKDDLDFFPSPPAVVARLVELADIEPGMTVLEPSAGMGAIAYACADVCPSVRVTCVEIDEKCAVSLTDSGRFAKVSRANFLDLFQMANFDRVVMNPPFSKRADIRHITHAAGFLKPGGRLVSVASSGVTFREDKLGTEFRAMIRAGNGSIEPLPAGSFKSSGTMVNTVIVTLNA